MIYKYFIKKVVPTFALAVWLSWLEHRPVHPKLVGSIPSPGTKCFSLTLMSLSLSLSPPPFLSKINNYIFG